MNGRRAAAAALDLLFPPRCAFCGTLMDRSGDGVCPACEGRLPYIGDGQALRRVGDFPCAVMFYYEDPVPDGVRALKFGKKSWRAGVFGRFVAQAAGRLAGQFDAVTYVPVSLRRNYERGFDQARLIARAAARELGMRAERTVRKVRNNRAQSSLEAPEARRENVKGVYAVPHPERVKGRRFLLIDDVATTGSTLSACAGALMEAGAASVVCAALAGGHPDQEREPRASCSAENSAQKVP